MNDIPMLQGDELYRLIPQRAPIVMVDTFFGADESHAMTGLHVTSDNIFCKEGILQEPGIIEHIAQSAAAFAGYVPYTRGEEPKLGFIGEVKKCRITRLPKAGSFLRTKLLTIGEAAGVTLIAAEVYDGEECIASCQMKIFIKDDNTTE